MIPDAFPEVTKISFFGTFWQNLMSKICYVKTKSSTLIPFFLRCWTHYSSTILPMKMLQYQLTKTPLLKFVPWIRISDNWIFIHSIFTICMTCTFAVILLSVATWKRTEQKDQAPHSNCINQRFQSLWYKLFFPAAMLIPCIILIQLSISILSLRKRKYVQVLLRLVFCSPDHRVHTERVTFTDFTLKI